MEYHFLKNLNQTAMPRRASSRRMMKASMNLFVSALQKQLHIINISPKTNCYKYRIKKLIH